MSANPNGWVPPHRLVMCEMAPITGATRRAVHRRAGGRCETCDNREPLDPHHLRHLRHLRRFTEMQGGPRGPFRIDGRETRDDLAAAVPVVPPRRPPPLSRHGRDPTRDRAGTHRPLAGRLRGD
jgi:hypothetical protein